MPAAPKRRPTKAELEAAASELLPDVLGPGIRVLLVGINPSLYSAAVGHHFARPGNRFWKMLHESGATDRLLAPEEDGELLGYGFGLTNVASRATARADELAPEELVEGARRIEGFVSRFGIECVSFLGVTAYRDAFARPKAVIGRQEEGIGSANVWVLPNPSGLNAHYQLPELARLFREMCDDVGLDVASS